MSASRHQEVIDPRLGEPPSTANGSHLQHSPSVPQPVQSNTGRRVDGLNTDAGASRSQSNPHPYYHYPSPRTHTPSQHGGVPSATSQSTQASPNSNIADHAVDGDASPDDGAEGQATDDPRRARACEACRGLKVRCDQDPAHPEIPCKRCAKAGRQCIITQPSRKRQKKADSRVAELERKLDALTAVLQQQQPTPQYGEQRQNQSGRSSVVAASQFSHDRAISNENLPPSERPSNGLANGNKRRRLDDDIHKETPTMDGAGVVVQPPLAHAIPSTGKRDTVPSLEAPRNSAPPSSEPTRYLSYQNPEEFARRINSLVSSDLASSLFNRYTEELCPHLPAVVFPSGTTAEQVFKEKPILYVCILSAASAGIIDTNTAREINRLAIGTIADCVIRSGAKSLELIQAMQVIALWYKPPEQAEATNFYQIIHMAAVMALDIGLGKRFNPAKARRGFGGPNANFAPGPGLTLPQDSDTLEARRAWLCCYYLCVCAAMVLRRPNLVRWTNYMKECIEVLETHPDAIPSDRIFCQYVKIQRICEDIGLQFLMDDSTATISIKDPKVTYALTVLEAQLKNWKEGIPQDCQTKGLQFFEHVACLYLHEIALHFNHNVDDFKLPFTEESLKSVNDTSDTLTQSQMAALEACLRSAHGILDLMMTFDVSTINSLPMLIYFVRCIYAIVILIKMHVAVSAPNSELGKMMKSEDLRVDHYLDSIIRLFSYVLQKEGTAPHPKILRILNVLRDWFIKHKRTITVQHGREQRPKQSRSADSIHYQQTPLHLLSQVATGDQQITAIPQEKPNVSEPTSWTFSNPSMVDYSHNQQGTDSAGTLQVQSVPGQSVNYPMTDAYGVPIDPGMVDPSNLDFGWGTGFEQAMDLALGGMDGLQGTGLDNWFLGESVAPFGFQGEMSGPQTWQ